MRIIFGHGETALMSLRKCFGASQFRDMNMRLCPGDGSQNRAELQDEGFRSRLGGSRERCYCRNRKNWIEFEIGTVTVCCPFCSTCGFVTVIQDAVGRFVVDSSVKPGTFNGQVRTAEPPERA